MSILQIDHLSHAFGDRDLYRNASLALYKGEHMGIVGPNGAGKSTLIKILLGEIVPSDGQIVWQRNLDIGHLDQYAAVDETLTIDGYLHTAYAKLYEAEAKLGELYMQMDADASGKLLSKAARLQEYLLENDFYAIDSHIAKVAAGLGLTAIGLDRTLSTLSGGQRAKVILAKLLLSGPDVLLLDEPTNFLDAEHIQWLTAYLNAFEGCFMIVSHDFDFLEGITNCVCDIEFQTMKKYHGKYSDFVRQKEHQREAYQREYTAQQREIKKLETYIAKNGVRASTAKMARSRQKKLDKMDRLTMASVAERPRITFDAMPLTAARALEVQGLAVGYDQLLLPRMSFVVPGGEKMIITGFNGIGKSTLLKTLMGQIPALGGQFAFSPEAKVGYFEQDMRWADGSRTPLEIIGEVYPKLLPKQVRRMLSRCGVKAEHVMRPISTLSGGEQNKVKLCRLSMTPYNFLILDEPTNHLDALTKESLREAIMAFEGTVILVCHEASFYQAYADKVLDIAAMLADGGAHSEMAR